MSDLIDRDWMTAAQCKQELNIPEGTIRGWVRRGLVEVSRIAPGKTRSALNLYRREDVERMAQEWHRQTRRTK